MSLYRLLQLGIVLLFTIAAAILFISNTAIAAGSDGGGLKFHVFFEDSLERKLRQVLKPAHVNPDSPYRGNPLYHPTLSAEKLRELAAPEGGDSAKLVHVLPRIYERYLKDHQAETGYDGSYRLTYWFVERPYFDETQFPYYNVGLGHPKYPYYYSSNGIKYVNVTGAKTFYVEPEDTLEILTHPKALHVYLNFREIDPGNSQGKRVANTRLYDLLCITPEATGEDIRKAYRTAALAHHPDKNQGNPSATAKFQKVQHAYEVLSDAGKRARYDATGE